MPQPMWRHGIAQSGPLGRLLHNPPNPRIGQRLAFLAGRKHRVIVLPCPAQREQLFPKRCRQLNAAGLAPLAENRDLAAVGGGLQIAPADPGQLGAACARSIEQKQQQPVALAGLENTQGVGNGYGCDALTNGTTGPLPSQYIPCGQIFTSFEDDTGDFSDDLLQRIVVTQGTSIIYDSGIVDYGPAGPSVSYPVSVILNYDANFGFWPGASVGPNNGNCSSNSDYPLTSPANPGKAYVVESGKTCQEPVPGVATFTTFTALATPEYTKVTGIRCTRQGVASPCYTVKWTKHHEIRQDWNISLN